jgi:hypothetical protein
VGIAWHCPSGCVCPGCWRITYPVSKESVETLAGACHPVLIAEARKRMLRPSDGRSGDERHSTFDYLWLPGRTERRIDPEMRLPCCIKSDRRTTCCRCSLFILITTLIATSIDAACLYTNVVPEQVMTREQSTGSKQTSTPPDTAACHSRRSFLAQLAVPSY